MDLQKHLIAPGESTCPDCGFLRGRTKAVSVLVISGRRELYFTGDDGIHRREVTAPASLTTPSGGRNSYFHKIVFKCIHYQTY